MCFNVIIDCVIYSHRLSIRAIPHRCYPVTIIAVCAGAELKEGENRSFTPASSGSSLSDRLVAVDAAPYSGENEKIKKTTITVYEISNPLKITMWFPFLSSPDAREQRSKGQASKGEFSHQQEISPPPLFFLHSEKTAVPIVILFYRSFILRRQE